LHIRTYICICIIYNNKMKFIYYLTLTLYIIVQSVAGTENCEKDFFKTNYRDVQDNIQNVLLIWYPTAAGADNKLRWCSSETGRPLERHCNYNRTDNATKWEEINNKIFLINCSSIEMQCPEEPFTHRYIMKNHKSVQYENVWNTALINEIGYLKEPCLLRTGLPVTRRCLYNPATLSAEWEPIHEDIHCLKEIEETIVTYNLSSLYKNVKEIVSTSETVQELNGSKVINQVSELLKTSETVLVPTDIKISADILKIVTETNPKQNVVKDVLNMANVIMTSDPKIVRKSQEINATTDLLNTLENYLHNLAKEIMPTSKCNEIKSGVVHKAVNLTSVFYINPTCSNISGIALFTSHNQRYDENTHNHYRFLYLNQSLNDLMNERDLHVATYFPQSLWNKLKTVSDNINDETVLTLILYPNDLLFASSPNGMRPKKHVLDISIPDYSSDLPEDVPFIFRLHRQNCLENPKCGFWNTKTSEWKTDGVTTESRNIDNRFLLMCHTNHLTNFGALIGAQLLQFTDSVILNIIHEKALDYISILGSCLSLFGLICIWLTAICFRSWRGKSSNKILLNICLVLTLINLLFIVLNLPEPWSNFIDMYNNVIHCRIIGIFLHYNVLVLFAWMLIIAVMQYQRYVTIMAYERPSQYIMKYGLIAWCVPIIPTICVAYLEPDTYMPSDQQRANKTGICYPSGNSMYLGVLLPVGVIILANLCIFIYILYSLHKSLNNPLVKRERSRERETKNFKAQVRLTILLFFLLGISWIFGLLSHLKNSPVFSYIFCTTSTLQGFVLFIYFIIIDDSTRDSWLRYCCSKDYYPNEQTDSTLMSSSSSNRELTKVKSAQSKYK
ncbi:hypothetical protein DOY81_006647, partial [Sarcophaga bullata]